jgi:5S rRNA maturation endonuclease (ribonuclease M5)
VTPIETVLETLEGARKSGAGWSAKCPAHEDRAPSLAVAEGDDGKALVFCHAGCPTSAVVKALGLEEGDLFPPKDGDGKRIVAEYAYTDEAGAELFRAVRFEPKAFRQKRREGDAWTWNLNGTRRVLYRLPELLEGVKAGKTIYVAEGEKDVEALRSLGLVATCNPMGAGKWRDEYAEALKGGRVVVIADKDEPGRKHAAAVLASLSGKAAFVVVAEVAEGKDAAEWIAQGATRADFESMDVKGPEAEAGASDPRRLISTSDLFDEYVARKSTIVPCALAGLGKILGGGFETAKNVVVTAPAGGGKTAFIVQNAAHAVTSANFFAVLALKDGDQWADGLRLAQMAGVDRFELRDREPAAVEAAREAMGRYAERLMFYDVTKPGASFLDMAERALQWVDGRGGLLLGTDSIHVFAATDPAKERGMQIYDRIALRFETMHDFLVANNVAGLTVGQSGRASYSRKREEENVDLLAALSGGHVAENTVDVLIVATKPNENGTRFLVIPKSRLGGQGARVPVRYDEDRSLWSDADAVAEEAPAPKEIRSSARAAAKAEAERKAAEDVARLLRQTPEGLTAEEIRESLGRRRDWIAAVLGDLNARGHAGREVVERLDAKDRRIRVSVWKWRLAEAA